MIEIKFKITKTSVIMSWGLGADKPPVKGAYKDKEKENSLLGKWFINIDNLDELIELQEEVDEKIIIGEDKEGKYIEIYDDYRET